MLHIILTVDLVLRTHPTSHVIEGRLFRYTLRSYIDLPIK